MDEYEEMIEWALGRIEFKYNLRQALFAWEARHPDLPTIIIDDEDELVCNMKLFMFQITKYWLESKNNDDKPGLFRMIKALFRDLFKRKPA